MSKAKGKEIMRWLLCKLGFHDWAVIETQDGLRWKCKHCGKVER